MTWPEQFRALFRDIEHPLSVVLNAQGWCRERWVQGELFRRFWTPENGFQTDSGREKYDLYCPPPREMIAELKVIPSGFTTGQSCKHLKRLTSNGDFSWDGVRSLEPRGPSLFAQMLRLRELATPTERYLILVVAQVGNDEYIRQFSDLATRLLVLEAHDRLDSFDVLLLKLGD